MSLPDVVPDPMQYAVQGSVQSVAKQLNYDIGNVYVKEFIFLVLFFLALAWLHEKITGHTTVRVI
jgi:hypothetical protein